MKNNSRDWGIDLVRIISTYGIVVIIICLPYIFFARMIHTYPYKHIFYSHIQKYLYPLLISWFLIVIIFGQTLIPSFINEPILGCLFLILALNFSFLPENIFLKRIVLNLSEASF